MTTVANEQDNLGADELEALQSRLALLARETIAYPLECSLGAYQLLFESRDDIEVIVDNLNKEILISRKAA
jgi:hypothetical protein